MAETFASIASGASSQNIDLWSVTSYQGQAAAGLVWTVTRQAMVLADPNTASNVAAIQAAASTGSDFGVVIKPSPNAPDMVAINTTLQILVQEVQQLILLFGGLPATPPNALGGFNSTQQ
jgi:hypothetical protein